MRIVINCEATAENSTGGYYARALRQLGVSVWQFYDVVEVEKGLLGRFDATRRLNRWRLQKRLPRGPLQEGLVRTTKGLWRHAETVANSRFLDLCKRVRPSFVLVCKGKALHDETLLAIRASTGARLLHFNADDPANPYATSTNMDACLPLYDFVFTWSKRIRDRLSANGLRRVEYLPFGYDPQVHRISAPPPTQDADVIFVGAWDKGREAVLGAVARDVRLTVWGPGWRRATSQRLVTGCVSDGFLDARRMGAAFRSAKICVNLLRDQNRGSHNMRSFEIPAMGGFMLTTRSEEHHEIFTEGHGIACFSGVGEFLERIDELLPCDSRRHAMAARATKTVRNAHSYVHRAQEMLSVLRALP